jgi:hypothetical protein
MKNKASIFIATLAIIVIGGGFASFAFADSPLGSVSFGNFDTYHYNGFATTFDTSAFAGTVTAITVSGNMGNYGGYGFTACWDLNLYADAGHTQQLFSKRYCYGPGGYGQTDTLASAGFTPFTMPTTLYATIGGAFNYDQTISSNVIELDGTAPVAPRFSVGSSTLPAGIFKVPSSTGNYLLASVSNIFDDNGVLTLIILSGGVYVGFYVMQQLIALIPHHKEKD